MNDGKSLTEKVSSLYTKSLDKKPLTSDLVVKESGLPLLLSREIIWPRSFKLSNPGNAVNIGSKFSVSLIA